MNRRTLLALAVRENFERKKKPAARNKSKKKGNSSHHHSHLCLFLSLVLSFDVSLAHIFIRLNSIFVHLPSFIVPSFTTTNRKKKWTLNRFNFLFFVVVAVVCILPSSVVWHLAVSATAYAFVSMFQRVLTENTQRKREHIILSFCVFFFCIAAAAAAALLCRSRLRINWLDYTVGVLHISIYDFSVCSEFSISLVFSRFYFLFLGTTYLYALPNIYVGYSLLLIFSLLLFLPHNGIFLAQSCI